ncbi:hypothetical protein [Dactylosporangium sp. NPDC049140]|uniref:hypothetical protein n=1 Tax=Dactylosporangium sp. NPDC049140 TaxID=3155647 RepID=UPI003404FE1B
MADQPQDPTPPPDELHEPPTVPPSPGPQPAPGSALSTPPAAAPISTPPASAPAAAPVSTPPASIPAAAPVSTPPAARQSRPGSRSGRDRARRRAVRAHAAQTGVAYSIAARQLAAAALAPGESLANTGRTVYPAALSHGRWTILSRETRAPEDKLATTRIAARIPTGRARHLTDRFPPGELAGLHFYGGDLRPELLALVYLAIAHESPGLIPPPLDLAWTAELGEETAVDTTCADLDRAARALLSDRAAARWHRIDAALAAAQHHPEPATRYAADLLTLAHRRLCTPTEDHAGDPHVPPAPWPGVRQTLDALLIVSEDGHAPGTRVRRPGQTPHREGTVLGAHWTATGPPSAYDITFDDDPATRTVTPSEIVVLPGQESDAPALAL